MKMKEIMEIIRLLAVTQGFYQRLLSALLSVLCTDPYKWAELTERLEAQNFRSSADIVAYFEG